MADNDRPIHFRRNHQTTDEWYASTLDAQVRARWKAPPKDIKKRAELGTRLSALYGANTSSKMIRRRAGKLVHEQEKAAFNSPASLRRSRSPNKKKKGSSSRTSPTTTKRDGFTPNSDVLTTPMTTMSSTNIEANIHTSPNTPSSNQLGGVMMESVDNYSPTQRNSSNSPKKDVVTAT